MDVMRDHGLKVTFHLEPYGDNRTDSFASNVLYLITEYGDKRHWDCQLLLSNADGEEGPVFKGLATILPQFETDCHGARHRKRCGGRTRCGISRRIVCAKHCATTLSACGYAPIRRQPVVFSRPVSTAVPRTARSLQRSGLSLPARTVRAEHRHRVRQHRRAQRRRGFLLQAYGRYRLDYVKPRPERIIRG